MINGNTEVRLARFSDAPSIAVLSRDEIEFGLGWSWTSSRVRKAIRDRDTNVVVTKDRKILAGFGIMRYEEDNANLSLLAVNKYYRRRGVGTQIIEWLEHVAIIGGIFDISVQLRARNVAASAFYSSLGFEILDRVPALYRRREPGIIMTKQLGIAPRPD